MTHGQSEVQPTWGWRRQLIPQAQGPQVAQEGQAQGGFLISQQWSVVTTQISKTWQGGVSQIPRSPLVLLGYPRYPWGRAAEGQGLWGCGWRSYLLDVWLQGAGHAKDGAPGQRKARQPLKMKLRKCLWTQKELIIYHYLHEGFTEFCKTKKHLDTVCR